MSSPSILLTCEHGGNEIPQKYRNFFKNHSQLLNTHRGMDFGALKTSKSISKILAVPLIASQTSRLLIDLNRSPNNSAIFSEVSRRFSKLEKLNLMKIYYQPHHFRVRTQIEKKMDRSKRLLHFAIHSFTPVLNGKRRNADIGILFDPKSSFEAMVAAELKSQLNQLAPALKIRMNYPYKGTSDGLTKILRKNFGTNNYSGIEIEMNQKFFSAEKLKKIPSLAKLLASAILNTKDTFK